MSVLAFLEAHSKAKAAEPPPPPPIETVRLANGSVLMGRVLSRADGKIRVLVDGVGEVIVDSTAVAADAPSHRMAGTPSPWSGSLSTGVLYVSEIAPGIVGTNLGVEITSTIARALPRGRITLDGTLGYSRVEPVAATIDNWGLTLGFRHDLRGRFLVLATDVYEVNRVQYLKYRSTTLAGIGYSILKSPSLSLIAAPGLGYSKSEQTAYGRILSFGNRQPPGVEGVAWGIHDMSMIQLAPTIMLEQQLLWLSSVDHGRFRQAQLDMRLTGAVTSHVKMLIVYGMQYDSSMPSPVRKTIQSLNSGIQLGF
jgi:hypothetical protein